MSSSPGAGAARLVRGTGLAVLAVTLSAVAHALGGGHVPSVGMLAGMGVLLLPACVWVAGWQVRPWAAVLLLACGQAALHGAFSVLMACAPSTDSLATVAAHAGHGAAVAVHCAPMAETGRPLLGGASMAAFHALATVLTAIGVGAAERLVWWVRREIAGRLAVPAPSLGVSRPGRALPARGFLAPARALHLRAPRARRGPPATLLASGASPS